MIKSSWVFIALLVAAMVTVPACKAPAEFEVVSLDVAPSEVTTGETVSVTAEVKNTGGSEDVYTAILTVDGADVEAKEVTIAPGASETVTFSLVKDTPGTYQVGIGGQTSSLTVKQKLVAKEFELKYDNGAARGYISASIPWVGGHIVDFSPPATPFTIKKVRVAGVIDPRAGVVEGKTFDVEIWDKGQKVLHGATYPYTKFPVGAAAWVEFDVPNIEVNDRFYAHIYTDSPWPGPGPYIGADDSITNEHSNTTIRTEEGAVRILEPWGYQRDWGWFGDKRKVNWMIRVVGTAMVPAEQAPAPTSSPQPAPTAPALSQPTNESTVSGLTVKLEWNPSTDATSYSLQVATDSAFTKLVLEKTGIAGMYYELTSELNWKTDYYWRVNASNASGTSSWSGSWKFNTPVFKVGKIVFTSLRDGNAEIYVMNADGSNQTRLTNNPANDSWPSLSPDGTKITFNSDKDGGNDEVYTMDADGTNQTRLTNNPLSGWPSWSPDGTKIVFVTNRDGNAEIYVMNADGSNQTRLTNNSYVCDSSPAWSPDGTKIAFGSKRTGNWEIYVMNADGSNQTRITNDNKWDWIPAWSPDGTKIAYTQGNASWSYADVCIMNVNGTNQTNLTNNNVADAFSTWSPDGTKIAFHTNRDGNYEIYVMNADGSNPTRLTNSPAEDSQPSWR